MRKQNIVQRFHFRHFIQLRQQAGQRKPRTEQKRIAGNALPIRFNCAVCIHVFKTGRIALRIQVRAQGSIKGLCSTNSQSLAANRDEQYAPSSKQQLIARQAEVVRIRSTPCATLPFIISVFLVMPSKKAAPF